MGEIEEMVRLYRPEIVRCIKEPMIVSLLETNLLSEDDAKNLRSEYQQHPISWVNKLLDIVIDMQIPGKWTTFLQALKRSEYPYLVRLLEGIKVDQDEIYIKKIGLHRERLLDGIQLQDVLTKLMSHNVINSVDHEEIAQQDTTKGNHHAVSLLLDRMQCRLAPKEWYHVFLNVLLEQEYQYLLKDLEPEFLECQEKYMETLASIQRTCNDTDMEVCCDEDGACGSSMKENIMTEYADAEMPINNLSQPPQALASYGSVETSSSNYQSFERKLSNIEENLASCLNIKPELTKPLIEKDDSLTSLKVQDLIGKVDELKNIGGQWTRDILVLTSKVRIACDNHEVFELIHDVILKVFATAINNPSVDQNNEDDLITAVRQFLKDLESQGATAVSVKMGSILLYIRCTSLQGLLTVLQMTSNDRGHLDGIEKALNEKYKEVTKVDIILTEESIQLVSKWLEEGNNTESGEDSNPLLSDSDVEDEIQSIKSKMRYYQLELAEKALSKKNTVVCAPTGTGKTWVALYIIEEHLKSAKPGEGKVVFMARTGALIKQQYDRIRKHLPQFQTKLLQGDGGESQMLGEFLQDYEIFCFTPQILVNNLESRSVASISKFSLIILDECHHTKKDSPYSNLMRIYLLEKFKRNNKLPQIVGLTATLGVGKSSTDIDALDYIYHILALLDVKELSTVKQNKEEMLKETSEPAEETIQMQARQNDVGRHILQKSIEDTEELLEEMALMQSSLVDLMVEACPPNKESQEYNKWTHEIMKAAQRNVDDYEMSRNIYSCGSYLNIYNQALEVNSLLQTNDVIKFLADKHRFETEQREKLTAEEKKLLDGLIVVQRKLRREAKDLENPNVRLLSQRLRAMLQDGGDDSRAMVFVKQRATCKALAKFLDKDLKDIVRTHALYGKENRGYEEGMTQAVQDETVQKFRDGVYKVLIATSVGVEGIDIPDCNMALNYNFIGNEITKVQMRGRIRKRGGTNLTFVQEKDLDKERISAYKEVMMQRAMKLFDKERSDNVRKKIDLYQREEIEGVRFKKQVELAKRRRKTTEEDFEILCRRCNAFACYTSDVRTIKVQHIVIDKEFADRIITKPHKKPMKFDGFNKDRKMFCKKCPLDWGIVAEKDGLDCRILKLENFKLVNMGDRREVKTYKKWIDVPYNIPEISADDLPRLLGNDST